VSVSCFQLSSIMQPSLVAALELVSLVASGLFSGACMHVTLAEQPARVRLAKTDTKAALLQWTESFKTAAPVQASLAVVTTAASTALAINSGDVYPFGIAAGLFGVGTFAYTLFVLMPTNNKLFAAADKKADADDETVRGLIAHWGTLHNVRTVCSLTAFALLAHHFVVA